MAQDKVKGFQVGGDDYITKPFSSEELILRIRAILKRNLKFRQVHKSEVSLGKYQIDFKNYNLIGPTSQRKLTKKESDLLKLLVEHQGQVLERELLANMVWGDDTYFVGSSMDVFITRLRKYLSQDSGISIVNIHGVGFKLVVE
jgi:DNA-binding response OmpR family regulator